MPEENQYQPLTIHKIIEETPDARTFILEEQDQKIYQYKPGQFLTFNFPGIAGDQRRSYSISSSPDFNEPLSITVKRVENGEFSRYFVDHAKVGDVLQCVGVGGLFVLPEDINNYNQVFFLAAGSGITPSFSLIKA